MLKLLLVTVLSLGVGVSHAATLEKCPDKYKVGKKEYPFSYAQILGSGVKNYINCRYKAKNEYKDTYVGYNCRLFFDRKIIGIKVICTDKVCSFKCFSPSLKFW